MTSIVLGIKRWGNSLGVRLPVKGKGGKGDKGGKGERGTKAEVSPE
jgi:hypothetical protein